MSRVRRARGFTLVEVVVVIVVLAVLAAIAITGYGSVTAKTHDSAAIVELSSVSRAAWSQGNFGADNKYETADFTSTAGDAPLPQHDLGSSVGVLPSGDPSLAPGNVSLGISADGAWFGVAMMSRSGKCAFLSGTRGEVRFSSVETLSNPNGCLGVDAPTGGAGTLVDAGAPAPYVARVPLAPSGAWPRVATLNTAVSDNGRYMAFVAVGDMGSPMVNPFFQIYLADTHNSSDTSTWTTTLVSHTPAGDPANGDSSFVVMAADGSVVVFSSAATDLVAADTNTKIDVFSYNVASGDLTRISANTDGSQATADSGSPAVSSNGNYVVYTRSAGGSNVDVYMFDASSSTTVKVTAAPVAAPAGIILSVSSDGTTMGLSPVKIPPATTTAMSIVATATGATTRISPPSHDVSLGRLSGDGNFAVWAASVSGATDQVFRWTRASGAVEAVSTAAGAAGPSNGAASDPVVSPNGRFVAFMSEASDLTGDTLRTTTNIFRRDMFEADTSSSKTVLMSQSSFGGPADAYSFEVRDISNDGRFAGFNSQASNLDPRFCARQVGSPTCPSEAEPTKFPGIWDWSTLNVYLFRANA